ncbi:cytochrome b [Roseibium album]|uniref:cytochrome b n=1 Tax=Roseibium album TaxID=311410 RepID=UPI002492CCF3|nr:cytochrome b/b6 domain-containing protein [Roseibium album]
MSGNFRQDRLMHWVIAVLVLAALASGFAMTRTEPFSLALLQAHLGCGIAAGLLTLLRVLIWFKRGAPQPIYPVSSRLQKVVSRIVHGLLRLVPLALLASGVGMIAFSGAFPSIREGTLQGLVAFQDLPPRNLHHMAALLLAALTALHVGAAIWHFRKTNAKSPS